MEHQTQNEVHVEAMLRDLIPNFLNGRKAELEEIKKTIQAEDYEALAQIGHRLKGTSLNYGFTKLGNIALQLELAGKYRNLKNAQEAATEIDDHLQNVSVVYINSEE